MNTPPLVTTEPAVPRRHPGHIPGEPILRVQHLSVSYESGRALEDVSFELITGERVAVVTQWCRQEHPVQGHRRVDETR